MDASAFVTATNGKGRRGGSDVSKLDSQLKKYAALRDSDADVATRKAMLDDMRTKADAYQAAKPGGDRTPGVKTLADQIRTELSYITPMAEAVASRASDQVKAARAAVRAQDAYLAAVRAGHPVGAGQQDPAFDRLISEAMNAGDRKAVANALIADDLAKIKALAANAGTDPLLKQILGEILANEGDISFGEGALSSGATVSSAKQKATTGKDYQVDLNIVSNPLGGAERVSSLVHEMTHIAVQTSFKNTAIHLAFEDGKSDKDVVALSNRRTKQIADLEMALAGSSADFSGAQIQLLNGKLAYPVRGKNSLQSYADTFFKKGDLPKDKYDRVCELVKAGANNTLIEFDTVINQMWFLMQDWKIPPTNAFVKLLKDVAQEAHDHRTA